MQLYIHIPFCMKKCNYCDFLSFAVSSMERDDITDCYIDALIQEMQGYSQVIKREKVATVFIGGGTPSVLSGKQMDRIIGNVAELFSLAEDVEISAECNPGTLTKEKLSDYRASGINRLSIGLQSAADSELKLLGRIHGYGDFLENYRNAREAGFDNINIDLISAIPSQTAESWRFTLNSIVGLEPEHISSYSLIIEPGTPFYDIYGKAGAKTEGNVAAGHAELPDEDTERRMYEETVDILRKAGYDHYEISNYARAGYECRHNIGYWTGVEYIGIGLGAASYINGERYKNISDIHEYLSAGGDIERLKCEQERLNINDMMEEFMFLGLRMMRGISKTEFLKRFGANIYEVYGSIIDKYVKLGFLTDTDDRIALTNRGINVSNAIMSEFILN